MHALFYQLIFHVKTKRCLTLLEVLEENEQTTAPTLVAHTGFGRRTIMKDIKELKDAFGETIQLIGDENGYHFLCWIRKATMKKTSLVGRRTLVSLCRSTGRRQVAGNLPMGVLPGYPCRQLQPDQAPPTGDLTDPV